MKEHSSRLENFLLLCEAKKALGDNIKTHQERRKRKLPRKVL